ncbi:MAG: hypothetical protein Q8P81_04155 [Nanoarchaeota archaeon]|nr:hypothetical protein [Nanoarchaeota archaeon]
MDRHYILITDAPRQRVKINVETQGHPSQGLPPKSVTGSIETFSYRLGQIGLVDPDFVDFHERVRDGDSNAEEMWTEIPNNRFASSAIQLRNNAINYDSKLFSLIASGSLFPCGRVLEESEIPVLFYGRRSFHGSTSFFENYFFANLKEEEFMVLDGTSKEDVRAFMSIKTLSGKRRTRHDISVLLNDWSMLDRYSARMLLPHEVPQELTEREISSEELKRDVENAQKHLEMEARIRRMAHPPRKPHSSIRYKS